MNAISPNNRHVLEGYSHGQYSAREAARRMGGDATIHDVIYQMREAGLPLPRPAGDPLEMTKARKMLGLTK